MGLFSKETCAFCGKAVGFLSRMKMKDKQYICSDCEKKCSAFFNVSAWEMDKVKENMEYMEKQDILYKKEFEPLQKKERIVHLGYYGITFADDIAMFEVIDPKASKKTCKELFRYDQIKDYKIYAKENHQQGAKKFSEVGVTIKMKCKTGIASVGANDNDLAHGHPYVSEFNILCARDVDDVFSVDLIINHLNRIFNKPRTDLFGSIKESFTGTARQKQEFAAANQAFETIKSAVKAGITNAVEDAAIAQDNLKKSFTDAVNLADNNVLKYASIADEAEKRAWN